MTPEQLREAAAVMLAASEGKAIQCRYDNNGHWFDIETPNFNYAAVQYRIKPEPRKIGVQLYEDQYGYVRAFTHSACVSKEWKPVSDIVEIEVKDE